MNRCIAGTALAALAALAGPAQAQTFPDRPVRLVVPFPPSGPIDVMGRVYAQRFSEIWGRPVVVENRPGATGTIGSDLVAKAPPDGYTLLMTVDLPIVMAPVLVKMPYDAVRDLQPVGIYADGMNLLAVHPSAGASDLAGLVAQAKARPGALTYSSAGNASPGHVCGSLIAGATGTSLTHVPYKGAAPAAQAVLSGEVSMFCGPINVTLPHVRAGKLRAMGVTGARSSAIASDIAPLAATFPGVVLTNWYALFAPRGTPAATLERLTAALKQVTDEPETRARLPALGLDPRWAAGDEVTGAIKADTARWEKVIRDANIKAD